MTSLDFGRCALSVCAAAAMLADCGGSQPPIGAGAMAQGRTIATHAGRGGSSMQPEAKAENLLYVSDYENNDVTVVTYPEGKLVGTLTGFSTPYGLCVDTTGDVWITSSSQIIEYAHGGANPIATLSDSGYTTTDCSVDPTTGKATGLFGRSRSPQRSCKSRATHVAADDRSTQGNHRLRSDPLTLSAIAPFASLMTCRITF